MPNLAKTEDDQESSFDFGLIWRPIRKYWLTSLAITILVTVAVGYYTMRQTKVYEAVGEVEFDPNPPRPLGGKVESVVELGSGAVWDTKEYYETQYQIIQSRTVALDVVRAENLTHDYCFIAFQPSTCKVPPGFTDLEEDDVADVLRGRLKVEPVKLSRIASVSLQDADPERAQRLLKLLLDRYRDRNVESVADSEDQAQKSLRTENDKLRDELEASEHELHAYKESKNLLSVEYADQSNMLREKIGQLNSALTALTTKRESVQSRVTQLNKVPSDDPSILPASELLGSGTLSSLRNDYVQSVRDRDALLREGKGKNHPDVLSATSKAETSRAALLDEVRNVQGSLRSELAGIDDNISRINGLYNAATKEALNLNLLEIDYAQLKRKKENTEKLYEMVLERSKENDLSRQFLMNNISIVDYPTLPKGPIKPNVPIFLGGGLAAGLLLGIMAAIGRWQLDRTIKTPADLDLALRATFLGLIPEIDSSTVASARPRRRGGIAGDTGRELYVHNNPMSGIAEAARSVRTNLLFSTPDNPYKALLITSAGPSEGKTTVACCIATAMAQANRRVLLIDCDLRRSRLHRVFGFNSQQVGGGLTTALLDGIDDCAVETEVPNLFLVSAGPTPPNPSEILESERFRGFLTRMKAKYDLVILDSPPIVPVTDATVLSTLVDATVFVVRAFKTSKDLVHHGGRMLSDVGSKVAGVVLNAVNLERSEYKYSYQYYRRGEYYSSTGDRAAPLARDNQRGAAPPSA